MSAVPSKLSVAFKGRVKDPAMKALKQLLKRKHPLVKLVFKTAVADYLILNQANHIALCQPATERPVFKSVPITEDQIDGELTSVLLFHQQLLQVAHFEQVSKLANPENTNGITAILDIQLAEVTDHQNFQQVGTLVAKDPNEPLFLDYHAHDGNLIYPAIQLKVQNKTTDSLWVTALFLGEDYSIVDVFMPVKEVEAGEPYEFTMPTDAVKDPVIGLGISDELLGWGIQDIQNKIKIISSRSPFTVDQLLQTGLVQAVNTTRVGVFTEAEPTATTIRTEDPNWSIQDIVLHIHRPQSGWATSATESVPLRGMQVMPHSTFSAEKVRLSSSENGTRSGVLGEKSPIDIFNTPYIQPYQQTGTRASQQTLDIIELHGIQNPEAVTVDNPLRVKLDIPLETGKVVIPFGYDKTTDLYIPMGFIDEDGQTVLIDGLPDESEASTRGFLKSIKIFLVETVRKVTGRKPKYPILALADVKDKVNDDYELIYIKDTDKIKEAVKKADRILIMVHGLIGDTSDKAKIMKRIRDKESGRTLSKVYDILLTFDYESMHRKIQKTGKDLKKKLEAVGIKKGHGKEVHIIAHSMGGLVSRWYMEKEGGLEVVNHFFQVGSPNLGSPIASKAQIATTALGTVLNFLPKPPIISSVIRFIGSIWKKVTVTTKQLEPTSKFYKELNGNVPEITIPYTLLPGDITLDAVDPKELKFFKRMLERYKQNLFKEGNDGIVGLSSMKGDKVLDQKMVQRLPAVPCNHFSYFNTSPGEAELARVLFELAKKNPNI